MDALIRSRLAALIVAIPASLGLAWAQTPLVEDLEADPFVQDPVITFAMAVTPSDVDARVTCLLDGPGGVRFERTISGEPAEMSAIGARCVLVDSLTDLVSIRVASSDDELLTCYRSSAEADESADFALQRERWVAEGLGCPSFDVGVGQAFVVRTVRTPDLGEPG